MKKSRVLVVEDNEVILNGYTRLLETLSDIEVRPARGGAEGIRLALSERPDLIVSDVQMPDVSGTELLEKLKKARVQTRVIFLTGECTDLKQTVDFVKLGVCDVLHKPVVPEMLRARVMRALALETTNSLYKWEPSAIEKIAFDTVADLQNRIAELESQVSDYEKHNRELGTKLKQFSQRELIEMVLTRLLYLVVVAALTVLFYRLGMIESSYLLFLFPASLFVLLSLPLDRVKSIVGKHPKGEASATFK